MGPAVIKKGHERWDATRRWIGLGMSVVALAGISILAVALWLNRFDPVTTELVLKNFTVIIGLPLAAIMAFVVVVFFKQNERPMTIKFSGVELSGSSGEVFLWPVCFVAIAVMIHFLWVQ
jgi:hypothetical protein